MKRQFILAFVLFVSSIALNAANSVPDDDKSDNKNKAEVSSVVKQHGSSILPLNSHRQKHWPM